MVKSICDGKPGETALDAVTLIAETVTTAMNRAQISEQKISYVTDHANSIIYWERTRSGAPFYRPNFSETIAAICAFEQSTLNRKLRATLLMSEYFALKKQSLPINNFSAQSGLRNLRDQSTAMSGLRAEYLGNRISLLGFCRSAIDIATALCGIAQYLLGLDGSMRTIPCLGKCVDLCGQVISVEKGPANSLANIAVLGVAGAIWDALTTVQTALYGVMFGYTTVTNNESIPNFFLLRLLVACRIDGGNKISAKIASDRMTMLLYRKQDWLFDLMQSLIAKLAQSLRKLLNVRFFLKGGRGIEYLLGQPEKGENDWDTQILIDPSLPWDLWWQCYYDVRSIVNDQLLQSGFVVSANLTKHAPTLIASTRAVAEAAASNSTASDGILEDTFIIAWQEVVDEAALSQQPELVLEAAWEDAEQKLGISCKAELIDVGIPRFYTIELLEQWKHVQVNDTKIPYPSLPYFVDELIAMIRENDAGVSPSPTKRLKRLKRLLNLLEPGVEGLTELLGSQCAIAEAAGTTQVLQEIKAIRNLQISALMTIMLGQFCTAYRLDADANMAAAFDHLAMTLFKKDMGDTDKLATDDQANASFLWCKDLSNDMMAHLEKRTRFILAERMSVTNLLFAAADGGGTVIYPVLEGSFAICVYRQLSGQRIKNDVGPAPVANATLYIQNGDVTQDSIKAVETRIDAYIRQQGAYPVFGRMMAKNATIQIFGACNLELGDQKYSPLMIDLTISGPRNVKTESRSGCNLLGLPSLTNWLRERAADVSEWAMRQTLQETFGALIEMDAGPLVSPRQSKL